MNVFLLDDGRLRSGWRFLISVFLVVVANFVAGNLSVLIAGRHYRVQEVIYRPLLLLLELAAFLFLTKLFDQPEGSPWAYIGLPLRQWLRESMIGALLGFGMVTAAVVVIAIFFNLQVKINFTLRTMIFASIVFGILLAAAMAEELMFRGYPFQRLVEGMGAIGAILVLSAMFGAVHMRNPHVSDNRWVQIFAFSNTLLIGIVLAIAYLRTRALWLPWGLHFGWNAALGLIYGLPVSGINQFSVIVKSKASGPEWLLGGGYGLEGGMLGTLVILLGLVYVLLFVKQAEAFDTRPSVDESLPDGIQPT
jgi:membrane protease YdiL (CAAX protease family)